MTSTLGQRWLEAGDDLGFRVTAPFTLTTDNGASFVFDALVHDFGSSQGMLLMERWDEAKAEAAADHGYGYSCIGAGPYDRESTIEVLQDWEWAGQDAAPEWLRSP